MISSSRGLINPEEEITAKKWGVTLTVDLGGTCSKSNHARLIFEGISKKNTHFYRVAHLTGIGTGFKPKPGCSMGKTKEGIVEISDPKDRELFKPKFAKKTPTWIVSKEKIEYLMHEIEMEKGREVPFNICGSNSIFSKPTEIYNIYDKDLAAIKKENEDLFMCLCDSAKNDGKCTGMSQKKFDETIAIVIKKCMIHQDYSYSDLIKLVNTSVERNSQYQDSCFTWARSNLKKIDIDMPCGGLERLIAVTTLYVKDNAHAKLQPGNHKIKESSNKCSIENLGASKPVFEKHVTYDLNRDQRTEDWKVLEKKVKINNVARKSAGIATCAGVLSFWVLGATAVPVIGLVAVPIGVIGFLTTAVLGTLGEESLKNKHHKLVKEKRGMNQPGNKNWDALEKIKEDTSDSVDISFDVSSL